MPHGYCLLSLRLELRLRRFLIVIMLKRKGVFLINSLVYIYYSIAISTLTLFGLLKKNKFKSSFYLSNAHTFAETSAILTIGFEILFVVRFLFKNWIENINLFLQWLICFGISYLFVALLSSKQNYFLKIFIANNNKEDKIKMIMIVFFIVYLPLILFIYLDLLS